MGQEGHGPQNVKVRMAKGQNGQGSQYKNFTGQEGQWKKFYGQKGHGLKGSWVKKFTDQKRSRVKKFRSEITWVKMVI